eukprot:PITA_27066
MASASKKLALRRLLEVEPIDIILLQETLGEVDHITSALKSISPGWIYWAMDVVGRSGGLSIGYNPRSIKASASWGGHGFMGLDFFSAKLGTNLRVVNIYGPCQQRENFWQHLLNLSIFSPNHIILGGDLNFSLDFGESWGSMAQVYSITRYMTNLLEHHNFVDVPMNKPLPTWRNRRVGKAALARRLDRFLMNDPLLQHLHHYKQWVGTGGISDHSPIYLEAANPIDRFYSLAKGFYNNLSKPNHLSINWAREKHQRENSLLSHIESELSSLLNERSLGFITVEDKSHLIVLENQKAQILKAREESLRLRSRTIWLKEGDDNTRFFQNYAKGRKVSNTIWNLPLPEGGVVDSFNKFSHLNSTHFRNLYKSPPSSNLADIINVA